MPLFWLSTAYLLGVILSSIFSLNGFIWLLSGLVFLLLLIPEKKIRSRVRFLQFIREYCFVPASLILAFVFFGAARHQTAQTVFTADDLAYYNDQGKVTIIGVITSYPDNRDQSVQLTVSAESITLENEQTRPVQGKLLARLPVGRDWHYGDKISLSGKLQTPAEDEEFSYRAYLAGKRVYSYITYPYVKLLAENQGNFFLSGIYALREKAYLLINRIYPQPESALLSGILLGIERDIPEDLEQAFQDTGTTHIIAISGFNITILAGLFAGLVFRFVPRIWSPFFAVLGITVYTLLVGAQPPVVRAAVMGSMAMFGRQIGRKQAGLNSLFLTAAIMNIFNPLLLWDAGFQLSFMATLGILLYLDSLLEAFQKFSEKYLAQDIVKKLSGPVSEYVLVTLAAQITTLPVSIYHFERFSLSSFLANILILPPQPLVMILGGISVIAGLVCQPLGQLLAWFSWPLAAYTNRMVEFFARANFAVFDLGKVSLSLILLYYLVLMLFKVFPRIRAYIHRHLRPAVLFSGLGLLTVVVWQMVMTSHSPYLKISILNIPDGPAVFLLSPDGNRVLINGGSSANQLSDALGRRLPLVSRKVDAVFLTRSGSNFLEGLPRTLERFPTGKVIWNPQLLDYQAGRWLEDSLLLSETEMLEIQTGQSYAVGSAVKLQTLVRYEDQTALLLEMENFQMLLPSGIPAGTIQRGSVKDLTDIDLILLTEEDLERNSFAEWEELGPLLLIAPYQEGIDDRPANWINLQKLNWVQVITDGEKMWVESR